MCDVNVLSVSEHIRPVSGVQRGGLPALVPAERHHRRLLRHPGTQREIETDSISSDRQNVQQKQLHGKNQGIYRVPV